MAINNTGSRRLLVTLTALFAALCGLYLLIGGGWLVAIGGSWYYPIAGLVMLGVAWMLWRSKRAALWLYAALLLGTMIWGVWEVGFDFWALTPRSDILVFFGIWLILPFVWRRLVIPASGAVAALVVALLISGGILTWAGFNDPQEINGTLSADATPAEAISPVADQDWPAYGRNQEGQRFSPLKQINADNVHNLKEAWVFRTGDVKQPNDPGEITNEVTPIKVGDTLYLCTAHQRLFALDAASGKEKWHYDPELKTNESFQHVTCRGVSYHEAKAETASPEVMADCPRRIILPVNDGRLIAINAENGKLCETFANKGVLNLQSNMPDTKPGLYEPTSPPIITNKTIVMAGSVTDNFSTRETSGVIRGFDVNTGELLWAFDPGAKDPNAIPSDEHTFTFNSPNSWAPAAYDAKLDLVYLPMGVTTPDIWGGNRTPEQERYASSILALNATTGKLAWSYQTVHHDLWDLTELAVPLPQAQSRGLGEDLMEELDPGRALPVELSSVAPPQDVVLRVHIGLAVACIAAPQGGLPEPADQLLTGDVTPGLVNIALIGDFIPHHGLAVAGAVVAGVLYMAVQILPLHGAMGHPRPGVIVEGHAVVH